MKYVYIAGRLNKGDRKRLEEIDEFCKKLGLKTYLPHKDAGLYEGENSSFFYSENVKALDKVDFVLALLDGHHIGEGTAWELGYAKAKDIPVIALLTEIKDLNPMVDNSVIIINNLEELNDKINPKA